MLCKAMLVCYQLFVTFMLGYCLLTQHFPVSFANNLGNLASSLSLMVSNKNYYFTRFF